MRTAILNLTTLRAAPCAGKGSFVDVELGLPKTAGADRPGGVGRLLENGLRSSEVVDQTTKSGVLPSGELVDDGLEYEGGVTSPGVEIVGAGRAWARNDDTRLRSRPADISVSSKITWRNSSPMRTTLTLAPLDLEPLDPMLAMTPALAMGDSEATYASAAEDCAYAPTASAIHDKRTERRISGDA